MARKPESRPGGKTGAGDDGELFRRTMGDAAPLKKRGRIAPVSPAAPATAPTASPAPQPRRPSARQPSDGPFFTPPAHASVAPPPTETSTRADRLAGIDRRTADRLRRGKLVIEGRLDLHGRFQEDAHRALNTFIADSAAAGRRVVLVITGKGRVSEGGGVLRRNVPHWLRLPPCAPHVLAVVPAQPQHGGSGALYVMLRRKRD